ncbi:MAG: bifunctional nuclease family protein [Cyanobacteria bacterium P01_F01_bin.42]
MIEMNVAGIALDASSRIPIVMLKDASERRALPIWIGQSEAKAILTVLEGQNAPRPMTHDLFTNVLNDWGINIEKIVIHALEDSTFYAVIFFRQDEIVKQMDSRPSDAIALALRCNAPIWVMEGVIADASWPVDKEADAEEREQFKEFIDNIQPSDFQQSLGDSGAASD